MSLVDFAISVWKGAGLLLGTGLLLYLAIAVAKTIMQEVETVCEVLIVLVTRFKYQTFGAHRSMKRLWNVLTTWRESDAELSIDDSSSTAAPPSALPSSHTPAPRRRSA